MIDLILMLLGLAFPNPNANTQNNNAQNSTTIMQAANVVPGDTGGETSTTPPKK